MSRASLSFVGLPGAGKTTYLAAFWGSCRAATAPTYEVLGFPSPETREYLQTIADAWFGGRKVERTASATWAPISLTLRAQLGPTLELRVPDLSGEAFRDAAAARSVDERVADLVRGSDCVMFFINAATARTPVYLSDLGHDGADDAGNEAEAEDFDPTALESDVLNAELLQLMPLLTDAPERPPPVAVIISAWDQVDRLGQPPREWLRLNQPMFSQVLDEYGRAAPTEVFGVSAQGGDYVRNPEVVERPVTERPLVVTADARGRDIAAPLAWFERTTGGGT